MANLSERELSNIYHRNVDAVYRLCYSIMKNAADAEDVVQDTFLRLISSGKAFENERHERSWLIVTASNLCKDRLKHWWRKNTGLEDQQLVSPDGSEDRELLQAVLALPDAYKTVVYMYYYEGYSTREISNYLSCTEGTVRSRLTRARRKLKANLGGIDDEIR